MVYWSNPRSNPLSGLPRAGPNHLTNKNCLIRLMTKIHGEQIDSHEKIIPSRDPEQEGKHGTTRDNAKNNVRDDASASESMFFRRFCKDFGTH